ncbi:MAG: 2-phospho-L-lactate transferase [Alphaproteobacteria bacterium]
MTGHVLALSGGVGGAKLALGLADTLPAEKLTVVANTGDDFEHLGLKICPDLDTVMYTLAGLADPERGWGRVGETWTFMAALAAVGGETWFQLGDGDLATHVERTRRLAAGDGLGAITADFCRRLGIGPAVLPATDDRLATIVDTADGPLPFQQYFVRERCAPEVRGFRFAGCVRARPHPGFLAALADPDLSAIVICPSNPFISIDPILSMSRMREAIREAGVPVVAVSPVVGGQAIKGPVAKMLAELGHAVTATAVAAHYGDLIDGFAIDTADAALAAEIEAAGPRVLVAETVMRNRDDKRRLADAVLAFAAGLGRRD